MFDTTVNMFLQDQNVQPVRNLFLDEDVGAGEEPTRVFKIQQIDGRYRIMFNDGGSDRLFTSATFVKSVYPMVLEGVRRLRQVHGVGCDIRVEDPSRGYAEWIDKRKATIPNFPVHTVS